MKLLIVDDDEYTREGLAEDIDWDLYGIDEVMQAANGRDALKLAKWYQPEIVLTDIRMPQKDGIAFTSEFRKQVPECRIIFITGYMQTDYLKSAIELSAVAFIEKPIRIEEVMKAVDKAVREVRQSRKHSEIAKDNLSYRKKRLVHLLLSKEEDHRKLLDACRDIGFSVGEDMVYICCFAEYRRADQEIEVCMEETEAYFQELGFCIITGEPEKKRFPIILACRQNQSEEMGHCCRRYAAFKTDYLIAAGYCVDSIYNIYNSGRMAAAAWEQSYFQKDKNYFEMEELPAGETMGPGIYQEFLDVYRNEPFQLRVWFLKLTEELTDRKSCRKDQIISLTKSFAYLILNEHPEVFEILQGRYRDREEIFTRMDDTENIFSLRELFLATVIALEEYLTRNNKYSRLINDICRYCGVHLSDTELCGQAISDEFRLSLTYLNILFKKELNVTIKQYISDMRMERAKDLLKNSYCTIDEIAAQCGYSTGNYFAKVFKENVKMTPSSYRKKEGQADGTQ